jgi:Mg-chelatase subunit ChlD
MDFRFPKRLLLVIVCCLFVGFFGSYKKDFAQTQSPGLIVDGAANPTLAKIGDQINVTLTLTKGNPQCPSDIIRRPLDIVLILDRSNSMDEKLGNDYQGTKLEGAVEAIQNFLGQLDPKMDQVALISFSSESVVETKLGAPQEIKNALAKGAPSLDRNGTNIQKGISDAYNVLKAGHRKEASAVFILLTDGNENQGSALPQAETVKQDKVRVVTIGLGPEVGENLLRAMATQPSDYYYAPSTSDLTKIYESVAKTIQTYDPATDIHVTYSFNASNFELVESSIQPEAVISVNTVTWTLPRLETNQEKLQLSLKPRVRGELDTFLNTEISYLECGKTPIKSQPSLHYPIQIVGEISDNLFCSDISRTSQNLYSNLCSFPWGWIGGLLVGLGLLILWLRQHWQELSSWSRCGIKLSKCSSIQLLLYLWLAVIAGVFLNTFAGYACATHQGLVFWRILPDRRSAIYLKSVLPDMNERLLTPLADQNQCLGCHTVNHQNQSITAIASGINGKLTQFNLVGRNLSIPALQGSYPAYSPDGTKVAYAANGEDIYILDLVNGMSAPLVGASEPGIVETMPAWSEDGKTIAFVRATGSNQSPTITVPCDIFTIPVQGGTPLMLPGASGFGFNYHPAYSPDGKWLAFTHHDTGATTYGDPKAEIYLVPAEGGAPRIIQANDSPGGQIIADAGNTWPTWSLDSNTLYFSSRRCGNQYDLYSTTINGEGQSTVAQRLALISDPKSYEYDAQEVQIPSPSWQSLLLNMIPWLIPLGILLILTWLFCRQKKGVDLVDTVGVNVMDPNPQKGWLRPQQQFQVQIEIVGTPGCDQQAVKRQVDVVLLMDCSDSMNTRTGMIGTRLSVSKKAAKRFVRCVIDLRDRVGLVSFADAAQPMQELTNREKDIIAAVKRIEAAGSTAMKTGIQEAVNMLTRAERRNTSKVILLLSDCAPTDSPSEVLEAAKEARQAGIRLIVVGIGEADQDFLSELVENPEDFRYVYDYQGLDEAFMSTARQLLAPVSATKLTYLHKYDAEKFELIPESDKPQADKPCLGNLVWTLDELDERPQYFEYKVKPLVGGQHFISMAGEVTYSRCGIGPLMKLNISPGASVEVMERKVLPDPIFRQLKPAVKITPPRPAWQPDKVLFIGIGGTGRWVLTHVFDNLLNAGGGELPDGLRFLLLDTNEYERIQSSQVSSTSFAGVTLPPPDIFILDENLCELIARWAKENSNPKETEGWLDPQALVHLDQELNLANGTYGRRSLPRIALLRNLQGANEVNSAWQERQKQLKKSTDIREWIKERCEAVKRDLKENEKTRVRVFIVGSMAGGMSGLLSDITVLARQIASEIAGSNGAVRVEGYLVDGTPYEQLPGDKNAGDERLANSYATIREIARFQLNPAIALNIGWGTKETVSAPLFDDLLIFSQEYNPGLAAKDGTTASFNDPGVVAQKILQNYIFPTIADVMAVRLDRAAGVAGLQDLYNQMNLARTNHQSAEHQMIVGCAGIYSIRLPVEDIRRALHIRWAYELMRTFLTGQSEQDFSVNLSSMKQPALFDLSQTGNTGFAEDPAEMVERFLMGGNFGGPAPITSQALCDYIQERTSELMSNDALKEYLQSDERYQYDAQRERFAQALLHILIGTSSLGSRGGRLVYAINFLKACEIKLFEIKEFLKNEGNQHELGEYAEICIKAAHDHIGNLEELRALISQNVAGIPQGMWEWVSQLASRMQNLQSEMDQVVCRKYLWGTTQTTANGEKREQQFFDLWWSKYLAGKIPDYLDSLGWSVINGKLDLEVRIDRSPKRLRSDGMRALMDALIHVASNLTQDAAGSISFVDLVNSERAMHSMQDGETAGKSSIPLCSLSQSREQNISPDYLVEVTPEALKPLQDSGTPFYNGLAATARGEVALEFQSYPSTDQMWAAFIHLRNTVRIDHLKGYMRAKIAYDRLDGYDMLTRKFAGVYKRRAVYKPEAIARELETKSYQSQKDLSEQYFDYKTAGILHPFVAAALQYPGRVEIFCLALADELIVQNIEQRVILNLPGTGPVILVDRPQEMIDPYVYALLTWVYKMPDLENWKQIIAILKNRFVFDSGMDATLLRQWSKGPYHPLAVGSSDRQSLGYLVSAITRFTGINNKMRWTVE